MLKQLSSTNYVVGVNYKFKLVTKNIKNFRFSDLYITALIVKMMNSLQRPLSSIIDMTIHFFSFLLL